jgi:competence protein ComEC
VRLEAWAITLSVGVVVGTVVPALAPMLVLASAIVSVGALLWRDLVPAEWRLMGILAPLFAAGGVGIAFVHAATPDPLAQLAALEPGEVVIVGTVASPPVASGWGYRSDLRVEHLWYRGREVLRGGGVEVFAADLSVGVGDRVQVDGEISRPETGEDGFDYARYLSTKRISAVVEATSVWPVDEELGWIGRVHRRTDVALGYTALSDSPKRFATLRYGAPVTNASSMPCLSRWSHTVHLLGMGLTFYPALGLAVATPTHHASHPPSLPTL